MDKFPRLYRSGHAHKLQYSTHIHTYNITVSQRPTLTGEGHGHGHDNTPGPPPRSKTKTQEIQGIASHIHSAISEQDGPDEIPTNRRGNQSRYEAREMRCATSNGSPKRGRAHCTAHPTTTKHRQLILKLLKGDDGVELSHSRASSSISQSQSQCPSLLLAATIHAIQHLPAPISRLPNKQIQHDTAQPLTTHIISQTLMPSEERREQGQERRRAVTDNARPRIIYIAALWKASEHETEDDGAAAGAGETDYD
ncbi:hypothetical protein B0J11DRAFT_506128 [Dendryphion nanum]|uniref:Uncharacterized protein n=1 Tax=Dendryphion nanum TaxID=256645 RepID=A0A9P9DVG5_9PLEO|nr:hypothetical protein B0J11DRAFT_506128 [Dendryphion nanum]